MTAPAAAPPAAKAAPAASFLPSLRVSAPAFEIAALGRTLRRLIREDPPAFFALFEPLGQHRPALVQSNEIAYLLKHFGLAVGDRELRGVHRIRRCGEHFYVMELGGVSEYRQDIWPETDALLEVLYAAQPGRLLDLGTGTGIIAIEAAARGHSVVATDLYETALALARFNAALNGLDQRIDFRRGHQLEPVAGERFSLILTAPHYTRVADQLRLEVLRAAPAHVDDGGRLVVATFLEWQEGQRPPIVDKILQPLVEEGRSVKVVPLSASVKRDWFTVVRSDTPLEGLMSRHRFLITIGSKRAGPGPGTLQLRKPTPNEVMVQDYVPLSRLRLGGEPRLGLPPGQRGAFASITTRDDITRLKELFAALREGLVTLDSEVPDRILDVCRYGMSPCVTADVLNGAAGAILDRDGGVRPCTHGQPLGRFDDTLDVLSNRLREASAQTTARRSCETCSAKSVCSRCLFPYPFEEAEYCDFIRAHADAIPLLRRLGATLQRLSPLVLPLRIKLRPKTTLIAAFGRPYVPVDVTEGPQVEERVRRLARLLAHVQPWIISQGGQRLALFWVANSDIRGLNVTPVAAALTELVAEGATAAELTQYLRDAALSPEVGDAVLTQLSRWFSENQNP
jgi:SAM-dependent methyltransferase